MALQKYKLPDTLRNESWYKWYVAVLLNDVSKIENEKNVHAFFDPNGNNLLHFAHLIGILYHRLNQ